MTERVKDNPILTNQEVEHPEEEKSIAVSLGVSSNVNSNSASSHVNHNQDNTTAIDAKTDDTRSENVSIKTCEQKNDTNLNSIPVQALGSDSIFDTIKSLSVQTYRDDNSDDNSDSSDSDSSSTVSEENDDSDNTSLSDLTDKKAFSYARTKGELTLQDLPPIEDLTITVKESKCKPIGSVFNMVDTMVIVQSFPNTPPLDIDTVLFLDRGQRPLGKIFDVFGPVQEPLYCVRFNSSEHIKQKKITKEQVVYCAPQTEYTSFIHTAELMKNVTEEMELKIFIIKKDPESKPTRTYVKPMQCSHCSKNTFSTCEECGKSFCHFECSLDGWRNHTSSECVLMANVIRSDTLNAPATPSPAAATPTTENASVKSERDMSLNNSNVRKYASDHSSPATEFGNFSNLAQDYIVNGNKSLEDASSPSLPKSNAVCNNNYDDNVIAANTSISDQQPEPDFQRHDKDGFNNQERGGGRNFRNRDDRRDQERGAGSDRGQGGSFKSRSDNRDGSSDHQRRNFDGGRDSSGSNADAGRPNENRDNSNSRGQSDRVSEQKGMELNQILQVTIASVEASGMCHVRLADNEGSFEHALRIGNEVPLKPLKNPKNKTKCMALFKNKWHRALILAEEPLRVRFVDTGDIEVIEHQNIRDVPEQLSEYRILAFRTKLLKISRDELSKWHIENKVISIKVTDYNKNDRYYVAEVIPFEEQLVDVRKDNHGDSKRPSTVSTPILPFPAPSTSTQPQPEVISQQSPQLRSKQPVEVVVTFQVTTKVFYVGFLQSILDVSSKLAEEDVNKLSPMVNLQEGGLALARFYGNWCRVKITCSDPLMVRFIDRGNEEYWRAEALKTLPSSFTNIPPTATRVKLYTGNSLENKVKQDTQIKITPIMKENDAWLVLVGDKSAECESILQQMKLSSIPFEEQLVDVRKDNHGDSKRPSTVSTPILPFPAPSTSTQPQPEVISQQSPQLRSKQPVEVVVTFQVTTKVFYVGFLQSILDVSSKLAEEDVNKLSPMVNLQEGGLALARFYGNWCRVKITCSDPLMVRFIDRGNEEYWRAEALKTLPSSFTNIPPTATRVKLYTGNSLENKVKQDTQIKITPIMKENDAWLVLVGDKSAECESILQQMKLSSIPFEEQLVDVRKDNHGDSKRPSTVSTPILPFPAPSTSTQPQPEVISQQSPQLRSKQPVEVVVTFQVTTKVFYVGFLQSILDVSSKLAEEDVNKLSPMVNLQEGGLALARFYGNWCRVKITCSDPLMVRFIDRGNEEYWRAEALKTLPSSFTNIPPTATRVKLYTGNSLENKVKQDTQIKITPIMKENDAWLVLVGDKSAECESILQQMKLSSIPFEEQLVDVRKDNHGDSKRPSTVSTPILPFPAPSTSTQPQPEVISQQSPQLRSKQPVEVVVTFQVTTKVFYVGFLQSILDVSSKLAEEDVNKLSPMVNLQEGGLALARFYGNWCRVKITCSDPLMVRFIDRGNEEYWRAEALKTLPSSFTNIPPTATRVKLYTGNSLENKVKQDTQIKITPIMKENDAWLVLVGDKSAECESILQQMKLSSIPFEEQLVDVRKDNHGDSKRPSTVSTPILPFPAPSTSTQPQPEVISQQSPQLRSKQPVEVVVTFQVTTKVFYVGFLQSILDVSSKLAEEDVNKLSPMVNLQEGGLALARFYGNWRRVKITCSDPLMVRFIDRGNEEYWRAEALKTLPSSFTNIPPTATRVKLYTGNSLENKVKQDTQIKITPIMKENDAWLVLVGDKSAECESILQQMKSLSVPSCSSTPVQPAPRVALEMLITYAESRRLVYGVPKNDLASLNRLTNMEADFEQATTLELNRIYVKKYEERWCRVRLVNIDPIEIYFIDYGNSEMCHKEEIYELTEELRTDPPPLAKKMVLENESRQTLEFNAVVSVSWDPNRNTYLLTPDPTDPGSSNASSNRTVS